MTIRTDLEIALQETMRGTKAELEEKAFARQVLRTIKSGLTNIEKNPGFKEEDVLKFLKAEVNTRLNSARESFERSTAEGTSAEDAVRYVQHAEKETAEAQFLTRLLPEEVSEADVEAFVLAQVEALTAENGGPLEKRHRGVVIKAVKAHFGDTADAKTISTLVSMNVWPGTLIGSGPHSCSA